MESAGWVQSEKLRLEQNLYGAHLFQSYEYSPAEVAEYISRQEMTHLAEGLELQQRSVRELPFVDGHVRGFGGKSMVEINEAGYRQAKKQYLAGDTAAKCLMHRRTHDIEISKRYDELMKSGAIGDGFYVASPYQEELDDNTAQRLGFWPQFRRSYLWFYRKISETQLECVDVSIDHSNLASYSQLLKNTGVAIPHGVQSHDVPAFAVTFHADEAGRDQLIDDTVKRYRSINRDSDAGQAEDAFESLEFLEKHARHYVQLLVDMYRAIAESLQTGKLHDLVRLASVRALRNLDCLAAEEISALNSLLSDYQLSGDNTLAFSTLISAQRYGIWESVSQMAGVGGTVADSKPVSSYGLGGVLQTIRLLDHVYQNTDHAAALFKTMPGCAGGTSFLQTDEADAKPAIFNGERYSFNKKMFCLVCQSPPGINAKPKWCGPCGICRQCDSRLKLVTVSSAAN
jgi:hypothetical protein